MKFFAFSFLIISFLACGNQQQNTPSTSAVKATDSIPTVGPTNTQALVSASGKFIDDLLKSGKKGIFEDSTFAAIIEDDFAVGITSATSSSNPYDGYKEFKYKITSYLKYGGDWKIKDEKFVISDSTYYKPSNPEIKLEDMDRDGRKDIMLLFALDGRGNQQYALFLVKNNEVVEVRGFKEVYAPVYDEKKKVIESTNNYHGGQTKEFYRLVKDSVIFISGIEELSGKEGHSVRKYTTKENQ